MQTNISNMLRKLIDMPAHVTCAKSNKAFNEKDCMLSRFSENGFIFHPIV